MVNSSEKQASGACPVANKALELTSGDRAMLSLAAGSESIAAESLNRSAETLKAAATLLKAAAY